MRLADVVGVPMWGSKADQRADELATLAGERDAARAECAVLRAQVAGLEARVNQLVEARQFYYGLWSDSVRDRQ